MNNSRIAIAFHNYLVLPVSVFFAASVLADIEIAHDPIEEWRAGERIVMQAAIEDDGANLETVRLYFKPVGDSQFYYVAMSSEDGEEFTGVLPAPAATATAIEYYILVKNDGGNIVKTQNFSIEVTESDDAILASGALTVDVTDHRNVESYHGKVLRSEGDVMILSALGETRSLAESGNVVLENETIETGKNGRVVVDFDQDPVTVVGENSQLKVKEVGFFSHLAGKVYFSFKKVFGVSDNPKVVENLTITVGIRGTKFISYQGEREGYALKEGRLAVSPTNENSLALERDGEQSSADTFDLEEGREINLSEGIVRESELSQASILDFKNFETFAGVLIGGALIAEAASSAGRIVVQSEGAMPSQIPGLGDSQMAVSKSQAPLGASSTTSTVTAVSTSTGIGAGTVLGAVAGGGVVVAAAGSGDSKASGDDSPCTPTTINGSNQVPIESHTVNLDQTSGQFNLNFEPFAVGDRLRVLYDGNELYNSACVSNTSVNQSIAYSGSSDFITVEVAADCNSEKEFSAWEFTVSCPQ